MDALFPPNSVRTGSGIRSKPIFWVYQTDGKIELNFKGLADAGHKSFVEGSGEC